VLKILDVSISGGFNPITPPSPLNTAVATVIECRLHFGQTSATSVGECEQAVRKWLQLRFDFDSTVVRLLIIRHKVNKVTMTSYISGR